PPVLFRSRNPALTVVGPRYVLAAGPPRVRALPPVLVRPPFPEIGPVSISDSPPMVPVPVVRSLARVIGPAHDEVPRKLKSADPALSPPRSAWLRTAEPWTSRPAPLVIVVPVAPVPSAVPRALPLVMVTVPAAIAVTPE